MACARTAASSTLTPRISESADASVCSIAVPFEMGALDNGPLSVNVEPNAGEHASVLTAPAEDCRADHAMSWPQPDSGAHAIRGDRVSCEKERTPESYGGRVDGRRIASSERCEQRQHACDSSDSSEIAR